MQEVATGTMEIENIFCNYSQYSSLVIHPIYLYLIWLGDFIEHAILMEQEISYSYYEIRQRTHEFVMRFNGLLTRAIEVNRFLRTGFWSFGNV